MVLIKGTTIRIRGDVQEELLKRELFSFSGGL